jgi:hypothetical protein
MGISRRTLSLLILIAVIRIIIDEDVFGEIVKRNAVARVLGPVACLDFAPKSLDQGLDIQTLLIRLGQRSDPSVIVQPPPIDRGQFIDHLDLFDHGRSDNSYRYCRQLDLALGHVVFIRICKSSELEHRQVGQHCLEETAPVK